MFSLSAFNRTMILLSAMLFMAAAWGIGRIPDANLLIVVFTSLVSALLADVRSFNYRLKMAATWAAYASVVQLLFSVSNGIPLLQIIFSIVLALFTFSTSADYRAGCIIMLTGYLGTFAPPGILPALGRCIDILVGVIIIMAVTTLGNAGAEEKQGSVPPMLRYSPHQTLILSAKLGIGTVVSEILQLQHGAWIMLTILFINMSKTPDSSGKSLAFQRIFAVPAGIIIGGFLLYTFSRIDTRFIWLLPFIGASGFFILYNYGDFFLFSIIFMVTLTFFSNWISGAYHRFNFWETFFSLTVAAVLGALLELPGFQTDKTGETA